MNMSNADLWGGSVVTLRENGGTVGALIPVSGTRYDRQAIVRALRSRWNLRRRPRIGGAEPHIRRVARAGQGPVDAGADQVAARWLRGLVPANIGVADASAPEGIMVTFDSWHNPGAGTEIAVDARGVLAIANLRVVHTALQIINSGNSVVVQVRTGQTIRVWVFNRKMARAVDATTLEQNHRQHGPRLTADDTTPTPDVRFATGWIVTGEPGGARPR